jgi:PIN domain nuclease of toxin-antitoxin system
MQSVEQLDAAVFDTHIWVWVSSGEAKAKALTNYQGRAIISAISIWEVAMLESKQRLRLRPSIDAWVKQNLEPPVELEPLHPTICLQSCRLPDFHGDPADRLIVATALILGVPLITADREIYAWNQRQALLQVLLI